MAALLENNLMLKPNIKDNFKAIIIHVWKIWNYFEMLNKCGCIFIIVVNILYLLDIYSRTAIPKCNTKTVIGISIVYS